MKKFILVYPVTVGNQHMVNVNVMRINVDHIVTFGEATDGHGYVETRNGWILTGESYRDLCEMISEAMQ